MAAIRKQINSIADPKSQALLSASGASRQAFCATGQLASITSGRRQILKPGSSSSAPPPRGHRATRHAAMAAFAKSYRRE
jgi:hypothetical protein